MIIENIDQIDIWNLQTGAYDIHIEYSLATCQDLCNCESGCCIYYIRTCDTCPDTCAHTDCGCESCWAYQ